MTDTYKGVVHKVINRSGRWSVLMNNEEWYGFGRKEPKRSDGSTVEAGDTVQFEFEDNHKDGRTYHNAEASSLKSKKGDGPPAGANNRSGGGRSGGGSRDAFWEKKEERDIATQKIISFAGAYNTAINTLGEKLRLELIKMTGSSKAAKLEAYDAMLDDEACRIFATINSIGDRYDEVMSGDKAKKEVLEDDLDVPDTDTTDDLDDGGNDDGDWD